MGRQFDRWVPLHGTADTQCQPPMCRPSKLVPGGYTDARAEAVGTVVCAHACAGRPPVSGSTHVRTLVGATNIQMAHMHCRWSSLSQQGIHSSDHLEHLHREPGRERRSGVYCCVREGLPAGQHLCLQ